MVPWKTAVVFILAVAVSGIAANYRFGDSSHAIGTLSLKGGKARHPFLIDAGKERYTLIMTGVVLPPYQGAVRIALEGSPSMSYQIYNSEPIIDLGLHRRPKLDGAILTDVNSGDKLALWVVMKPEPDLNLEALFDEEPAKASGQASPGDSRKMTDSAPSQPLKLNFYAADSGRSLLQIPVLFAGLQTEGGSHGAHH